MLKQDAWLVSVCATSVLFAGCAGLGWDPMRTRARSSYASGHHAAPAVHADDDLGPPPIDPSHVLLLAGSADRPCEVLGLIDRHADMGREADALERLRADAARLGADAVTHVSFEHSDDVEEEHGADDDMDARVDEGVAGHHAAGALHLSGTAVRFRDLVGGRRYEVIGRIEIRGGMGHEADALAELRQRGYAMRADLVMGIAFTHDDGDGSIGVAGTAVRFIR